MGEVLFETAFNTTGSFIVVVGDILNTKSDVVANSIGPKRACDSKFNPTGVLEQKFAEAAGQQLVNELEDPKHGPWGFGEIIYTESYLINKGEGWPQAICHFCVPRKYSGDSTYLIVESLFERALNIAHDKCLKSVAFPLIGAGLNCYPVLDVIKAILDACSFFIQKESGLKEVTVVVWEHDTSKQQIVRDGAHNLQNYEPQGKGFTGIFPDDINYSDPRQAFLDTIGEQRRAAVLHVEVLPITTGIHYTKYQSALRKVKAARPEMETVETFGWHGTKGVHANSIAKSGFDMSKIGDSYGHKYGKGAYFGKDAHTAHKFAILDPGDGAHIPRGLSGVLTGDRVSKAQATYTILLCKLITGKQHLGSEHLTQPFPGHDSARNGDGSYLIVFDADYILPIAIVEYTIDLQRGDREDRLVDLIHRVSPRRRPRTATTNTNNGNCCIL